VGAVAAIRAVAERRFKAVFPVGVDRDNLCGLAASGRMLQFEGEF
jgi:hypothetical protein